MKIALVWMRQDLRLSDNPALSQAVTDCDVVLPVFIAESDPGASFGHALAPGGASQVWLHHSLLDLHNRLVNIGTRLIIRRGEALQSLQLLLAETGATHVYWNRRYDPVGIETDTSVKQALRKDGCRVKSFNGSLLSEPWEVLKADETPYKVFTAFWKAKLRKGFDTLPLAAPDNIQGPDQYPDSLSVQALSLLPDIRWDAGLMEHWRVGESAAWDNLSAFLNASVQNYQEARNIPSEAGTSCLSPYLHFGEMSPRQIYYQAEAFLAEYPQAEQGIRCFLSEIGWREFAYYLLYHFPQTLQKPLDQRFSQFPWRNDGEVDLLRWQRGQTGFPIIDAGMRQLWATGWMHNRVRMIVASLLTKNLLIPWQEGEQWFRDTLVDADLASNVLGWQWVAGCGADAAPYFRIFNPVLQSEKFDPEGSYIRRWVPELANRPGKSIHQPLQPGEEWQGYPAPLVDLKASRQLALEKFAEIKVRK